MYKQQEVKASRDPNAEGSGGSATLRDILTHLFSKTIEVVFHHVLCDITQSNFVALDS